MRLSDYLLKYIILINSKNIQYCQSIFYSFVKIIFKFLKIALKSKTALIFSKKKYGNDRKTIIINIIYMGYSYTVNLNCL